MFGKSIFFGIYINFSVGQLTKMPEQVFMNQVTKSNLRI